MVERFDGDWTFNGTWPFEPRFVDTAEGRLHYVEVGDARTDEAVILVHGNPTWGYMYRHVLSRMADGARLRVLAVDLLGFGRSSKPGVRSAYALDRHVDRLEALLAHERVGRCSLVAHDWGAHVALRLVARRPERLRRLVVLNTFAPVLPGPLGGGADMRLLRRIVHLPFIARDVYQRRNAMVERFLFEKGLADPSSLDADARSAYRAPFPDADSRVAIAAFPLQIPKAGSAAASESERVFEALEPRLRRVPVLLLWGGRDPLFGSEVLARWQRALPDAHVEEFPDAGHYLLEEAPEETSRAIADFLS